MPAARGPEDSFGGLPPVSRRAAEDSYSSMPPARRSSDSARLPLSRGLEDSYSSMAPARRSSDTRLPIEREAEASVNNMLPARRSSAEDSYRALPPARRAAEDSYDALPPARAVGDSYSSMAPARRSSEGGRAARRSAAEDSYSGLPIDTGRRAAHRAEDLTPEFGRPTRRRNADTDRSLAPAMSSMEDAMPPARMPKHGRPEDYGVPSSRSGPEDSYDQMAPVRATGGRRRARA
jgi:hypothetical protein